MVAGVFRAEGGVDGRDRFRADAVWLGAVRQNDDSRIREGSYLVASWVWHAALAITGFAVNMWLGVVAVVLLTQSVAIQLRFRGQRRPKPMIAGVTEAMCLLLVFIAAIIICPHLA